MKTISKLFLLCSFFFYLNTNAQAPEKMSYQAVIRDAANNLVSNHVVGMKISLLEGSAVGPTEYVETQTPTTNANGLVSITIGNGTVVYGTIATALWDQAAYFLKTEIDPTGGTNYTITSTSQLLSVPFSLYSKWSDKTKAVDGEPNYIPVYDASGQKFIDSPLYQDGGLTGVLTTSPLNQFEINSNLPNSLYANDGAALSLKSQGTNTGMELASSDKQFLKFRDTNFTYKGFNFIHYTEPLTSFKSLKLESYYWTGTLDKHTFWEAKENNVLYLPGQTQIGLNSSPINTYLANGTLIGPSATQKKFVDVIFPFGALPYGNYTVIATPQQEGAFDDAFVVSVSNITPGGFRINVYRADGPSWGQNLMVNWAVTVSN